MILGGPRKKYELQSCIAVLPRQAGHNEKDRHGYAAVGDVGGVRTCFPLGSPFCGPKGLIPSRAGQHRGTDNRAISEGMDI